MLSRDFCLISMISICLVSISLSDAPGPNFCGRCCSIAVRCVDDLTSQRWYSGLLHTCRCAQTVNIRKELEVPLGEKQSVIFNNPNTISRKLDQRRQSTCGGKRITQVSVNFYKLCSSKLSLDRKISKRPDAKMSRLKLTMSMNMYSMATIRLSKQVTICPIQLKMIGTGDMYFSISFWQSKRDYIYDMGLCRQLQITKANEEVTIYYSEQENADYFPAKGLQTEMTLLLEVRLNGEVGITISQGQHTARVKFMGGFRGEIWLGVEGTAAYGGEIEVISTPLTKRAMCALLERE